MGSSWRIVTIRVLRAAWPNGWRATQGACQRPRRRRRGAIRVRCLRRESVWPRGA